MAWRWTVRIVCAVALVFVILVTECGVAQEPSQSALLQATPPQSANDALHSMSRLAGAIFTGQVVAVRRIEGVNGATGVVEIDFAVEDAVRGVGGSAYTLREWAGLWPAGDEPFRVGQRYLMLLHVPGAAGLSSPVGGTDGAIPIHGTGAGDGRGRDGCGGNGCGGRWPCGGPALGCDAGGAAAVVQDFAGGACSRAACHCARGCGGVCQQLAERQWGGRWG
jgi:hypothetical protein